MDSIQEKLSKLEALRQGATTEAEAANAASKIADICNRHNIDIGSVRVRQEETKATDTEGFRSHSIEAHTILISQAVTNLFSVQCYTSRTTDVVKEDGYVTGTQKFRTLRYYGLKANVAGAVMTHEYLMASVEAMLTGYLRKKGGDRNIMRSFRIGCAQRISERAKEAAQATRLQLAGNTEHTALVLIGNNLCKAHAASLKLRNGGQCQGAQLNDGFSAGYEAGNRVDIHGAKSNRMLN